MTVGVSLFVFFWPGALAAVTTFSIGGLSIASLVGTNVIAQMAVVAALAYVATSAAVYIPAGIFNSIVYLKNKCCKSETESAPAAITLKDKAPADAPKGFSLLCCKGGDASKQTVKKSNALTESEPFQGTNPISPELKKDGVKENQAISENNLMSC